MATSTIPMTREVDVDVSAYATVNAAWSNTSKRFIKRGNIVFFTASGYVTSYLANYTYQMVKLGAEIKPRTTPVFVGLRTDQNYNVKGYNSVHVNTTDSQIDVTADSTQGSWWFISGWFEV